MRGIPYDPEKHLEGSLTTWKDAGWLEKGKEDTAAEIFKASTGLVGTVDDSVLALVLSNTGDLHHVLHEATLPFCSVSGVTVAFQGRKEGFGAALTAELLAIAAGKGAVCAGLGMFEQGYYDRVGFSNMPYWRNFYLRPSEIDLDGSMSSRPVRLEKEQWSEIHRSRTRRFRCHGSVNLEPVNTMDTMLLAPGAFVMGFRDPSGELTHHICFTSCKGENGPLHTGWLAYRNRHQFHDLMLLLRSMGDQIDLIQLMEPPGIQLQSIVKKPLAQRRRSFQDPLKRVDIRTLAWTQCRILDLKGAIDGMRCPGEPCSFSLTLHDPVEGFLDGSMAWRGCSGEYTVHLSENSFVETGHTGGSPLMRCSLNTFTKMWNGTARPAMLPFTDRVEASEELLMDLERALFMPEPSFDWDL